MKTYWQKLKDPRWQKRRLEIMQRAEFLCEACGEGTKALHVHHKIYRKGADPWDYDNNDLQCLCEDCHEEEHSIRQTISSAMAEMDEDELRILAGFAQALVVNRLAVYGEQTDRAFMPSNHREAFGFLWGIGVDLNNRARLSAKLAKGEVRITVKDVASFNGLQGGV